MRDAASVTACGTPSPLLRDATSVAARAERRVRDCACGTPSPLLRVRDAESPLLIWTTARDLSARTAGHIKKVTPELEGAGRTVRLRTIYLGLTTGILGILITIWVVITLRPLRRLRAARQIAAGNYASRIVEKGPAEVAACAGRRVGCCVSHAPRPLPRGNAARWLRGRALARSGR